MDVKCPGCFQITYVVFYLVDAALGLALSGAETRRLAALGFRLLRQASSIFKDPLLTSLSAPSSRTLPPSSSADPAPPFSANLPVVRLS